MHYDVLFLSYILCFYDALFLSYNLCFMMYYFYHTFYVSPFLVGLYLSNLLQ